MFLVGYHLQSIIYLDVSLSNPGAQVVYVCPSRLSIAAFYIYANEWMQSCDRLLLNPSKIGNSLSRLSFNACHPSSKNKKADFYDVHIGVFNLLGDLVLPPF